MHAHSHTHIGLTALCPGLPGRACTKKVKPIWILLKQETVSGSGISWAICKSAPCSREKTTPAPHHSVFYRPDALPAAQPTVSKHWRHTEISHIRGKKLKYLQSEISDGEIFVCNVTSLSEWCIIVVARWTNAELRISTCAISNIYYSINLSIII